MIFPCSVPQIIVPCFRKTKGKIDCVELCEERLSCGHSCPLKCHYFEDRHHEKFRCKKPCTKSCASGNVKSNSPPVEKCKKFSSLQVIHASRTTIVRRSAKSVQQLSNVLIRFAATSERYAASNRQPISSVRSRVLKYCNVATRV